MIRPPHHLIRIYGRRINTMTGVHIFYNSSRFLYIGAFESERRQPVLGRFSAFVLHP